MVKEEPDMTKGFSWGAGGAGCQRARSGGAKDAAMAEAWRGSPDPAG